MRGAPCAATQLNLSMVPEAGLEPARLAAGDFESPASTDFATRADGLRAVARELEIMARGFCAASCGRAATIPSDRHNAGMTASSTPPYKTLQDTIGGTPLVRLQRLPGADNDARGNVILGKLEGNNPAGSVKDRPAISMIRRAAEARRHPGRRHADRGHLGQHRHRLGHGRGDPRLPHDPGDAGGPVDRTRADHEGLRRRAGADAAFGRHGVRARPGRTDGGRRQGPGARPVRQPRQPARALRNHRARDLGRYRRAV